MPGSNALSINGGKVLPDFFLKIYDNVGDGVKTLLHFPTVPRVTSDVANPNWMEWQIPTSTEGSRFWLYTGTRVVAFEVKFWAYSNAFEDVIVPVRWIRALQYPVSKDGDPKRPPLCLINLGKWLTMMGVIGNVGVAYNTDALLDGSVNLETGARVAEQEGALRLQPFSGGRGVGETVGVRAKFGSVPVEATVTFQLTSFRKANPAADMQNRSEAVTARSGADTQEAGASTIRFTMAEVMDGQDEKRFL